MKQWIVASLLLVGCQVLAGEGKEGTGVGSGGITEREQYRKQLLEEYRASRPSRFERRRDVREWDDLAEWCSRVSRTLKRERARASEKVRMAQDAAAEQLLVDALEVALMSRDAATGGSRDPMTRRLIERGLEGHRILVASQYDGVDLQQRLDYLFSFTQLVIDSERDFDQNWFIPYANRYYSCRYGEAHGGVCDEPFNYREFQSRSVKLASDQLNYLTKNFVMLQVTCNLGRADRPVCNGNGNQSLNDLLYSCVACQGMSLEGAHPRVFPVGSSKGFLRLAEVWAAGIADDLMYSLDRYAHACTIQDLLGLSDDLSTHNAHGDSLWSTDRRAVEATWGELNRLRSTLPSCQLWQEGRQQ